MNAPDAIERLRQRLTIVDSYGFNEFREFPAADARAILDHITALTAERDAAVAEVAQIVAYIREQGRLGINNKSGDRMLDGVVELMAHGALGLADAIAAGAHKDKQ
jgi:hypothetical protein